MSFTSTTSDLSIIDTTLSELEREKKLFREEVDAAAAELLRTGEAYPEDAYDEAVELVMQRRRERAQADEASSEAASSQATSSEDAERESTTRPDAQPQTIEEFLDWLEEIAEPYDKEPAQPLDDPHRPSEPYESPTTSPYNPITTSPYNPMWLHPHVMKESAKISMDDDPRSPAQKSLDAFLSMASRDIDADVRR